MKQANFVILFLTLILISSTIIEAQDVTLSPSADNTIYSESNNSNGAGDHLFAGRTNNGDFRRALIKFDFSDLPSGTITNAQLVLTGNRQGPNDVSIHKLNTDWGEGTANASGQEGTGASASGDDATWNFSFFNGTSWAMSGGDFEANSSADIEISNGVMTTEDGTDILKDVKNWVDNPSENFGWIFIGEEGSNNTAVRFGSKEGSNGPSLILTIEADDVCEAKGGSIEGQGGLVEFNICAGDGIDDPIDVTLMNNSGSNSSWIITDLDQKILDLPSGPPFNLEGAGGGTCLVWHISSEDDFAGAVLGAKISDFVGCFDLSNSITIVREGVTGGQLTTSDGETELSICAGDGVSDAFDVTTEGATGANSTYVITTSDGEILDFSTTSTFDLEGAGEGICLIRHLSFADGLEGAVIGGNISDFVGCYDFSNAITVVRSGIKGGTIAMVDGGTEITICAGDGESDAFDVTLEDNEGTNQIWVITDQDMNILGLPSSPVFDLEGAGQGTCLIWSLSFEDGLEGAEVDGNTNKLEGCFAFSNPITVTRNQTEGGSLAGGPFAFTVGDGEADMIEEGAISLTDNTMGSNSQWVITDIDGDILGLPSTYSAVNFDDAGEGTCLVSHLSYEDGLKGLEEEENISDLSGCFHFSNAIEVVRTEEIKEAINLTSILSGYQENPSVNTMASGEVMVTLTGNTLVVSGSFAGLSSGFNADIAGGAHIHEALAGSNGGVVVALTTAVNDDGRSGEFMASDNTFELTDDQVTALMARKYYINIHSIDIPSGELRGQILPSADSYVAARLEGLNHNDVLMSTGDGMIIGEINGNSITLSGSFADLQGDFAADIGGGIHIHNGSASQNGSVLTPLSVVIDTSNKEGTLSASDNAYEFTEDDIMSILAGGQYINIHTTEVNSGEIRGQLLSIGNAFPTADFAITAPDDGAEVIVSRETDQTFTASWSPSSDGDDEIVYIWQLSSDSIFSNILFQTKTGTATTFDSDMITIDDLLDEAGLESGQSMVYYHRALASDGSVRTIGGSSSLALTRQEVDTCDVAGGTITGGPFAFTVGDDMADMIAEDAITLADNMGDNSQWVITDMEGKILGLPSSFSDVNFDGAGPGTCLIRHLSYEDGLMGLEADANIADFSGCFNFSNTIEVVRTEEVVEAINMSSILSGYQENPSVNSMASGTVMVTLAGNTLVVSGSFAGLSSGFNADIGGGAHIHEALAGSNGGVVVALTTSVSDDGMSGEFVASDNTFELTDEQVMALMSRKYYINIHSIDVPSGELRGQILPSADSYVAARLEGLNHNDVVISTGVGMIIGEINGNSITLSGSFADLQGDFAADIGGGIHIHNGSASQNGSVLTPLSVVIDASNKAGTLAASDNAYELTEDDIMSILAGGQYINIHTTEVNSGEIRGQLLSIGNAFPSADFAIIGPDDGAEITISRETDDTFIASWSSSSDGDDEVVYLWQISKDSLFTDILFQTKTGVEAFFVTDMITLDDLVASSGLEPEQSMKFYHRALASDGSVRTVGGSSTIIFTRQAVDTCDVMGGTLEGGPFAFTVGDDMADMLAEDAITLADNAGMNSQWVITDMDGKILGLPDHFSNVNFDGAGAGTCLVRHLSYDEGLTGLEADANIDGFEGCFDFSNAIEVVRTEAVDTCDVMGGTLEGGPFAFTVGDDMADMLAEDAITLADNSGMNSQWVITDMDGKILGLPDHFSNVNFDGAGSGTCLVRHLSYDEGLTGLEADANIDGFEGCFDFSNAIEVVRTEAVDTCDVMGGTLEGGPFAFTVGDDMADMLAEDAITLADNAGMNSQWVITDMDGKILGLPDHFSGVNFDGAGSGTCLVRHLSYDDGLTGLEADANISDLEGCFNFSNSIEVVRTEVEACDAMGGTIEGGPFAFAVGDDMADMLAEDAITLADNSGMNSQWVITDMDGKILGLPDHFSNVNFDGAGPGTCLVKHLSYDDGLTGLEADANISDLEGCFDFSNAIEVVRTEEPGNGDCVVTGGELTTASGLLVYTICVNDGIPDPFDIRLTEEEGDNSTWIITDSNGIILALPTSRRFDLEGAGLGTCLIYHMSSSDELDGVEAGLNIGDVSGCFSLSNPIMVHRISCDPDCQTPLNVRVKISKGGTIKVRWDRVKGTTGYEVMLGFVGKEGSFVTIPVSKNSIRLSSALSTDIELKIRSICANGERSDFTEAIIISPSNDKSASSRSLKFEGTRLYGSFTIIENDAVVAPNPARNFINLNYSPFIPNEVASVTDISGRNILNSSLDFEGTLHRIDISTLDEGIYILTVHSEAGVTVQKRFVKVN